MEPPIRCDRRQLLSLGAAGLSLAASAAWRSKAGSLPRLNPDSGGDLPRDSSRQSSSDLLRIGLISDLNSSYGSTHYIPQVGQGVQQLVKQQPALLVCAGDMVAGQKRGLSNSRLDAMWDGFARTVLQPIRQAGIPFLMAVGNHDGAPGFAADRAAARRFWEPRREALGLHFVDRADFPFHYSVLQNDVFWLVWDASSSNVPAEQLQWARRQLNSNAARTARMRMVVGHLPLFGISQGRDRPGERLHQAHAIQTLLEEGNVQAYISGHQHAWYPARLGQLDLIQLGALGSGPRSLLQGNIPRQQTYTRLDINWRSGALRETTYAVATQQAVRWDDLPAVLSHQRGRLRRNLQTRQLLIREARTSER